MVTRVVSHTLTLCRRLRKRTMLEGKRVGRKMNANQKRYFEKEIKGKNSPCVLISSQNYEYEFRVFCFCFVKTEKGKTKKEDRKLIADGWKKKKN